MLNIFIHKCIRWFIIPFVIFLFVGLLMILLFEKGTVLMHINKFSSDRLDCFFLFVTDFGLGGFAALIAILLGLYKIRWSILLLSNLGLVALFSNLLKRIFFQNITRPFHYFLYDDFHRFIHDAPLIYYSSFPSGHTMTIFAVCSMLSYLFRKQWLSLLFFLLAILVGLSRIYLLQHFFIDVYFGSILGILTTLLAIWIIDIKLKKYHPILDKGLFQLFRKTK